MKFLLKLLAFVGLVVMIACIYNLFKSEDVMWSLYFLIGIGFGMFVFSKSMIVLMDQLIEDKFHQEQKEYSKRLYDPCGSCGVQDIGCVDCQIIKNQENGQKL